ncbi:MAG: hypothetical protein JXN60_03240 [Lentisphaerae bacterium]|nr:hypothetical protein [Lentisphaerota bacterium]
MSLIQEALRRQQEEAGEIEPQASPPPVQDPRPPMPTPSQSSKPPTLASPELPPPVPNVPPPLAPTESYNSTSTPGSTVELAEPTKQKPPILMLTGVILSILLLAGIGIWAAIYLFNLTDVANVAPTDNVVEVTPETKDKTPVSDTPPPPAPSAPAEDVKVVTPVIAETDTGAIVKDKYDYGKEEEEPVVQPANSVVWPMLTLSGVVGKGSNGSVILNNEIVGVGEYIDGVKVVSLGYREVTLEYEGQQQTIKQGNSTQ